MGRLGNIRDRAARLEPLQWAADAGVAGSAAAARAGRRLGGLWRDLRHRQRRVWASDARVWIAVRAIPPERAAEFDAAVQRAFSGAPEATWARYNAPTRRVVVALSGSRYNLDALVERVATLEAAFELDAVDFDAGLPRHPGDAEPITLKLVELAAGAAGLLIGSGLRVARVGNDGSGIDIAAALTTLENVPWLRGALNEWLGEDATELLLNLGRAADQALMQSWMGPVFELVNRALQLRELNAEAAVWQVAEPVLASHPEDHQDGHAAPQPRPRPLPDGPIEEYVRSAAYASLGAFGFGLASTHNVRNAAASLLGGIPKAARTGRESFAAHLAWRLTRRGVVVMNPDALRLLDRLDCLVVEDRLLDGRSCAVGRVVALEGEDSEALRERVEHLHDPTAPGAVQRAGRWALGPIEVLGVRIPDEAALSRARELDAGEAPLLALTRDGWPVALATQLPDRDRRGVALSGALREAGVEVIVAAAGELAERVRAQQRLGRGVFLVAADGRAAWRAADLSLALRRPGLPPPWGADLICPDGLSEALFVIDAISAARRASRQGVLLARLEAATGLVLAFAELEERTVRRIMAAANSANLASLLNGLRLAQGVREPRPGLLRVATPWHALDTEVVLRRLGTRPTGLDPREAARRVVPRPAEPGVLLRVSRNVADELANPLTPVLAAGAGISALLGSVVDASMVGGVVALNALIGGVQRFRTERLLRVLIEDERVRARVLRDGQVLSIGADQLVRGDVIVLQAGDVVPADCRALACEGLEVDEAAVSGESLPVRKDPAPTLAPTPAERHSMLYEGTTVHAGTATAVVVACGDETEMGRSAELARRAPEGGGVEARLESLTAKLTPFTALSGVGLVFSGIYRKRPPAEVIGAGVSLAVAAVPEGLPILATMAQLAAAGRLSERGALVRNPRAIEALGRIDVLCADKTGTLTAGHIRLRAVCDGSGEQALSRLDPRRRHVLAVALRASPHHEEGSEHAHATDRAVIEGARGQGVTAHESNGHAARVAELPFSPQLGLHAALWDTSRGHVLCVKGAPEVVIPRCTRRATAEGERAMRPEDREQLEARVVHLARRGYRVLAVAERAASDDPELPEDRVERLVFQGFVALADPVRPTARQALADLRKAGVEVKMITGDHPSTAAAIASELGLLNGHAVCTGPQIDALDDEALIELAARASVFARVTPEHKLRIVEALQRGGRVVGMAGDGANDAPAIRLANVGIALGAASTAAARQAADLVVTDERIETVVHAVIEGRALWAAVRDAVSILVGGNAGEVGFSLLGGLLSGRPPLNARQLLLVNLLTDTVPALAIAVRRPEALNPEQLLGEGPETSLGKALERDIAWRGLLTGGSAAAAWTSARMICSREEADTVGLLALVGGQLSQTLVAGHRDRVVTASSLASLGVLLGVVQTPGVSHFFGCRPLGPIGLAHAAGATALSAGAALVAPRVQRWRLRRRDEA